jgi:hypothetical protein
MLLLTAPALSQPDATYARIGDVQLTVAQVQAAVDAAGASTRAEVQAIADELVNHELLLSEARRRGLERHVLVRDTWRTLMVQRFMRREFDARLTRASISSEAIRARFDEDPSAHRRGFDGSAEGIRGTLWRERRDREVETLLNICRFGCAHCARQLQNDPTTPTNVFGSPVPEIPDWARRGATKNAP